MQLSGFASLHSCYSNVAKQDLTPIFYYSNVAKQDLTPIFWKKTAFTLDFQFIIAYNSVDMKLETVKLSRSVRMMFNPKGSPLLLSWAKRIFKFKIIQTFQGGK
ncbi:MAG: hypothetical protein KAW12_13910 [Candidatus Aminicenantes bacterium]|nr:hypothetical protein [Candidatus Aminicenantes bacterium]